MTNWTTSKDGVSNSSDKFLELVAAVERLIRDDAHKLIAGRADMTARLIVAQLAHVHFMAPIGTECCERLMRQFGVLSPFECVCGRHWAVRNRVWVQI